MSRDSNLVFYALRDDARAKKREWRWQAVCAVLIAAGMVFIAWEWVG
jgi:hypothetical protein